MAPSCQGDESFGRYFEALIQSRRGVEGDSKSAILQSAEEKSSKKQKVQPDMQVQLAVESVIEHGIQVAAMLPGGLSAMGIYLYAPDAAFTKTTHQLCQILDGMAAGPATAADKLLFVSSHSRKCLCKQRPPGTASSAALPICDFKLAPILSGVSIVTCRYQTRLSLPIIDSIQQLSTHVESAISAESQRIQQSVGIIQGSIASSTVSVADVQQPTEVELLSSPACCCTASQQDTREASVSGRVLIEGVLHGRAMVSKKDSLAAAVDFLKADVINTLQARMDILTAEAEELAGSAEADHFSRPPLLAPPSAQPGCNIVLPLPARVFFPVQQALSFSDYFATGETLTEMTDRLQPLLGPFADISKAEFPEGPGPGKPCTTSPGDWDPRPLACSSKAWLESSKVVALVTSVAVAVIAGVVALYLR